MTYHHEHDPMESAMVDVGTFGIDRGEDDYVPADEYVPEGEPDEQDDDWPVFVTLWSEDVSTWGEDTVVLTFAGSNAMAEAEAWVDARYAPRYVLHYVSADFDHERPNLVSWSVYREEYASLDDSDQEPIAGSTVRVSSHITATEAEYEAARLQAEANPNVAPPKCMTCGGLHLPSEAHSTQHEPTRQHLFTFLVDIPEDGDWDADDVRRQIGDGTADMYDDEPIDMED